MNFLFERFFEFEVLTTGPMRVGWARADCAPGCQLGSDEFSWAFDGYNVSVFHLRASFYFDVYTDLYFIFI
jgi:ryanodine receptor 2